jgi:uronate dehydrogenase
MSLVLVTGATGEVARGVLPFLEKEFDLRLLSLDPPGDDPRRVQADLLDWEALTRAMNGVDGVLHLAVASGHSGLYENDAFNDLRFDVNVKGTYHVFESALRARVRRVVYVSSVMVSCCTALLVSKRKKKSLVPGDSLPIPLGTYAVTKTLGEQIAWHYGVNKKVEELAKPQLRRSTSDFKASYHGLEVITLRIAAPLDITQPEFRQRPVRPQQVPVPDLAQAFCKALTVSLGKYEVVTIVGSSSHQLWDLGAAQKVLGYNPQYYLDDLGVTFAEPFDIDVF